MTAQQARWVTSVVPEYRVLDAIPLPHTQPEVAYLFGRTEYYAAED